VRDVSEKTPRRRRPAVQAELELPPAPGSTGSLEAIEAGPAWWQGPWFVALLAAAEVRSRCEATRAAALETQVRTLTLRPASQVRALRITPNPRSWSAEADAALRWPEPPELLEIYLPVAYSDFRSFAITVDKVDTGRVLDVERVAPDSNRELRLSLNSSAFGPGEYRFRLQGYTWRGERVDAGWIRLVVKQGK
jgi:hypothetical protein